MKLRIVGPTILRMELNNEMVDLEFMSTLAKQWVDKIISIS